MIRLSLTAVASMLICTAQSLLAQQNVGIDVTRGTTSLSGAACGFDCADPNNTASATALVGDRIAVRLQGDGSMPAAILIGIGPSLPCSGIPVFGFQNALLIDPALLLPLAPGVPSLVSLSAVPRCRATGDRAVLSNLNLTPTFAGFVFTLQGIVFDRGTLTFTRPVELDIV
jgi:hypothetical protein